MKRLLTFFNILAISVVGFNLYTDTTKEVLFKESVNDNRDNYISYNILEDDITETEDNEIVEDNEIKEEFVKPVEEKKPIVVDKKEENKKEPEKETPINVVETFYGSMSGYGPDCYGCTSNRVASGYYVGEGNIYYNDSTYGKVRIVSGDKKYPFGTIVKISSSNVSNEPIMAIVLDCGGNIGIDKKFAFDLLFATEKEASKYGVSRNVKFEILRLGY